MSLTPPGNPEHFKSTFWLACMDAQVWEMKEALAKNDMVQFKKELCDCILVGYDALRLMGFEDSTFAIFSRFAQNLPKFTKKALKVNPRDTDWYLAKIEKIRKELGH